MRFEPLAFRPLRTALVAITTLGVTGWLARAVEEPAWRAVQSKQPALKLDNVQGALGQGVTVGLLGGFRAIVADFFWIKMNAAWESYDLPATQTLIKLVTTIDPRPRYFWQNGARILAYDTPNWRIRALGTYDSVPAAEQQRIDNEQADVGLALLHDALVHHPNHPQILVEIAMIHLNRRKDRATAAEFYRKAHEQPGAPYYAGRIYAELLRRMGRHAEAYAWLKALYPTLPKETDAGRIDPATGRVRYTARQIYDADAEVVLERIRELEGTLAIPEGERFKP